MSLVDVATAILPPAQRLVWPRLDEVPHGFVLYGGTALALQLGHRTSVDFDLFTSDPVDPDGLLDTLALLRGCEVIQREPGVLTVRVTPEGMEDGIRLSFFGGLDLKVVANPLIAADNGMAIASILDVGGTKAKTIQQRIEVRDYIDLAALIEGGMSVDDIIGACITIFGAHQISAVRTAQTMAYFDSAELADLPGSARTAIADGVRLALGPTPIPALHQSIAAAAKSVGR